jgi:hypothetical protein
MDFEEPIGMLFGPVVFVAITNVCYTLGWVVDTILYNGRHGRGSTSRDDSSSGSRRATRSLGCGRMAHHRVYREKTGVMVNSYRFLGLRSGRHRGTLFAVRQQAQADDVSTILMLTDVKRVRLFARL